MLDLCKNSLFRPTLPKDSVNCHWKFNLCKCQSHLPWLQKSTEFFVIFSNNGSIFTNYIASCCPHNFLILVNTNSTSMHNFVWRWMKIAHLCQGISFNISLSLFMIEINTMSGWRDRISFFVWSVKILRLNAFSWFKTWQNVSSEKLLLKSPNLIPIFSSSLAFI